MLILRKEDCVNFYDLINESNQLYIKLPVEFIPFPDLMEIVNGFASKLEVSVDTIRISVIQTINPVKVIRLISTVDNKTCVEGSIEGVQNLFNWLNS